MRGILIGLLLAAAACSGSPPETQDPEDIAVGLIAPLSRIGATVEGAALAVDEINRTGGLSVGGRQVRLRLLVEDS